MPRPLLTQRQLNRATLARQMLLARTGKGILEATEHLLGMQAQVTNAPYIALWNRIRNFRHEDMTALIRERKLVRAATMRSTLHLHTARDLIDLRALVQPVLDRAWQASHAKNFGGADRADVIEAGRKLLDAAPMTSGTLGKALHQQWPGSQPLALAQLIHVSETLVQIPPTRLWGSGHAPLLARIENWLDGSLDGRLSLQDLVLRYLRAFGPASVADMQAWCGLTKLDAGFAALRNHLEIFEDDTGRELFDLPKADRPEPETPAPVRFMADYDNVILGYADRRRMLPEGTAGRIFRGNGYKPVLLVDGVVAATWALRHAKGTTTLEIETFRTLLKREIRAVESEAANLLAFVAPEAKDVDIQFLDGNQA